MYKNGTNIQLESDTILLMVDGLGLKYDKGIEIIYSLEKKEIPKFQGSVQCTVRFPGSFFFN